MNRHYYPNLAVDLKRYFCKRYNHYKRKTHTYLNCTQCPASDPETGDCYMLKIIQEMTKIKKRKSNDDRKDT